MYGLSRSKFLSIAVLAVVWIPLAAGATVWAGSDPAGRSSRDQPPVFQLRSGPGQHPLGLSGSSIPGSARIRVHDTPVMSDEPAFPGERLVLTTVGVESYVGETVFHPLLAVLVDRSFDKEGEWLAVWNLGHKSPGFMSHFRALIPGWISTKRPSEATLRKLNQKLAELQQGRLEIGIPKPSYTRKKGFRRSGVRLVLSSIKVGWGFVSKRFWPQFLYRNYLLRRNDFLQRDFQHTFLGLTWYTDQIRMQPDLALQPDEILDLKFRMLANRSTFGMFVRPEQAEEFVHGYETELRDHLWGTSNRLAADANVHHLGFEEFHRYTEGGVPMALGGVLYYDPRIAPEPDQIQWSIANPFDLTYNPFRDPEVQKQAESGEPVPLALYTYQSNMALKPIITVDFFRPSNPRIREAATYWRRLLNEGFASSGILGLFYNGIRRALTYAANRKGLTWLSDHKVTMGVEELRLSLASGLYVDPEVAEPLVDQIDRVIINPLVQSAREQGPRARVHYAALTASQGREVLETGRRLRNREVRWALDLKGTPDEQAYAAYGSFVRREQHRENLEICLEGPFVCPVPTEELAASVREVGQPVGHDDRAIETLILFRRHLEEEEVGLSLDTQSAGLLAEIDRSIGKLVGANAVNGTSYRTLLGELELKAEKAALKRKERRLKDEAKFFSFQMNSHLETLTAVVEHEGDLTRVSPWYITRAAAFFREVPGYVSQNPYAAKKYRKKQKKIEKTLPLAIGALQRERAALSPDWLLNEGYQARLALQMADQTLRAGLSVGSPARSVKVEANGRR